MAFDLKKIPGYAFNPDQAAWNLAHPNSDPEVESYHGPAYSQSSLTADNIIKYFKDNPLPARGADESTGDAQTSAEATREALVSAMLQAGYNPSNTIDQNGDPSMLWINRFRSGGYPLHMSSDGQWFAPYGTPTNPGAMTNTAGSGLGFGDWIPAIIAAAATAGMGGYLPGTESLFGAGAAGAAGAAGDAILPGALQGTGGLAGVAAGGAEAAAASSLTSSLPSISSLAQKAAVNAALQYAQTGTVDVGKLATSLVTGAVGSAVGGVVGSGIDNKLLSAIASGAASGATSAALSGGDITQGALTSALASGAGYTTQSGGGTPTPDTPTATASAGGDGAFVGGYEDMTTVPTTPTNVAGNVVDPAYGVNPRPGASGDPYQGLNYSEADIAALNNGTYSGPEQQPVNAFPDTQPINYGMTPTGTPAGGLTPTGGGVGLTQTAPSGAAITGGIAGGVSTPSVGGIEGSGTSVFDTFLDKLSTNPIQTAIKAAQVVSGIASGVNAMNAPISPTDAQRMADPFASSRQQYIDKLNALMANPSLVMSQPGYQFALQQGMQELNRNLSKSGMSTSTPGFPGTPASGAAGIAQQKYGQKYALKSYDDYVNQLSGLSGATQKPSAGSDAYMGAQKAASDAANSGWKSIDQGVGGLLSLFGKSPQTGSTATAPPVGGGSATGGTTATAGGNFSPAQWNDPNWFLNPAPSGYVDTPTYDYTNPGTDINYSDYSMYGP